MVNKKTRQTQKNKDTKAVAFKDKIKSSYYLDKKTEEQIVAIYLKRLKEGQRARKSNIIEDAVELLFNTELQTQ